LEAELGRQKAYHAGADTKLKFLLDTTPHGFRLMEIKGRVKWR